MPRHRLPDTRKSLTHKGVIRTNPPTKFFLTAGLFEDGSPGELFITMNDVDSPIRGWANTWSIALSMCLQHGVPWAKVKEKFSWQQFDPQGMTDNPKLRVVKSIPDYAIRWMDMQLVKKPPKREEK